MYKKVGRPSKEDKRKIMKKQLMLPIIISFFVIASMITLNIIDIYKLVGDSTANTINIQVGENYTLENDSLSCISSNDGIVKAKVINNNCVLTGVNVGKTTVEIFSSEFNENTYTISVNHSISIRKRSNFSQKSISFRVSGNDDTVHWSYCLMDESGICNKTDYYNVDRTIKIDKIEKNINRVCVYAYDENNNIIGTECSSRGWFNIFW